MRTIPVLVALALALGGCRGTEPYISTDLTQVRAGAKTVRPIYVGFRAAFLSGNTRGILSNYRREQRACRLMDTIDARDSIDPNVNLFAASVQLDNMCNAIESAYTYWAQRHGAPYDKGIVAYPPYQVFNAADVGLPLLRHQLRHPAQLG